MCTSRWRDRRSGNDWLGNAMSILTPATHMSILDVSHVVDAAVRPFAVADRCALRDTLQVRYAPSVSVQKTHRLVSALHGG